MGRKPQDLTGRQFGLLTAMYPTEQRDKRGSVYRHCVCECGNEIDVSAGALMDGKSISFHMKENKKSVSTKSVSSHCKESKEEQKTFDASTVDFCFKELMQNDNIRKNIIAALLNVPSGEVENTELMPTILRKRIER